MQEEPGATIPTESNWATIIAELEQEEEELAWKEQEEQEARKKKRTVLAEAKKKVEEAKKKAEEEARKKAEEEARKATEARKRMVEEAKKKVADKAAKRKAMAAKGKGKGRSPVEVSSVSSESSDKEELPRKRKRPVQVEVEKRIGEAGPSRRPVNVEYFDLPSDEYDEDYRPKKKMGGDVKCYRCRKQGLPCTRSEVRGRRACKECCSAHMGCSTGPPEQKGKKKTTEEQTESPCVTRSSAELSPLLKVAREIRDELTGMNERLSDLCELADHNRAFIEALMRKSGVTNNQGVSESKMRRQSWAAQLNTSRL